MDMTIFWLITLVVLILIEILTMGLTTIWFAGGALIAIIAAAIGLSIPVQVVAFLVVSIVLLFFTRPLAVKYFNKDRIRTNAESMVGKQAVVISEVDNLGGTGGVRINGMDWTARAKGDGIVIPVGTVVTILAIQGVKLIVEEGREGN